MATSRAQQRKIGSVSVPAVGFGTLSLCNYNLYGTVGHEAERLKLLDEAYARGCTHWDTADAWGDSEELIGKWFEKTGKRSEIYLSTKFGGATWNTERPNNGDPEYMREQLQLSLKNLQTDYIDLYVFHRVDPNVPIEITVGAMAELVREGIVRQIGLSEVSAATLRRAQVVHPIAAVQTEYSLYTLDIEEPQHNVLATARELGVAVVAYCPLGRGVLTGTLSSPDGLEPTDFRRMIPRYAPENFHRLSKITKKVEEVAKSHQATPAQVALAWLLAQGDDILVIAGAKQMRYIQENLESTKVVLTSADIEELRSTAQAADLSASGSRFPPGLMGPLLGDTRPL